MDFLELLAQATDMSTTTLIAIFFVLSLAFLLAVREFLFWYLRLHKIQNEVQSLREEIKTLRMELANTPKKEDVPGKATAATKEDRFEITH